MYPALFAILTISMYQKELEQLGLSEKEAKVYLASLELGADTAQNIAKKAGINRATAYVQIDQLKEKALMSEFEKGKKTLYVSESPSRLTSLFDTLEASLELKKAELERVLPSLQHLFEGMGERPRVRFFEGLEGMKFIKEDLVRAKDKKVYSFVNLDNIGEYNPDFENEHVAYRMKHGIFNNIIYTRDAGEILNYSDPTKLREAHYLPKEEYPFTADISIYDNKVVFEGYRHKIIGIIIENDEIAQTLKAIFLGLWKRL